MATGAPATAATISGVPETRPERFSRRGLFGAGLGRLAGHYLDRLDGLSGEMVVESPSPGRGKSEQAAGTAWRRGDLATLARRLEPAAAQLVEVAGVDPGEAVLDVGAGDGNVALAAVRASAAVTACDLNPAAVELGSARTGSLTRPIEWQLADVEDLPFDDDRFDAALSSFAAVYAPAPRRAMAELTRVVHPGGVLALTAWTPSGPMGRLLRAAQRLGAATTSARRWGAWDGAYLHFMDYDDFEVAERRLHWRFESGEAMLEELVGWPGPIGWSVGEDAGRRAALRSELETLVSFDADQGIELEVPYAVIFGPVPYHGCGAA